MFAPSSHSWPTSVAFVRTPTPLSAPGECGAVKAVYIGTTQPRHSNTISLSPWPLFTVNCVQPCLQQHNVWPQGSHKKKATCFLDPKLTRGSISEVPGTSKRSPDLERSCGVVFKSGGSTHFSPLTTPLLTLYSAAPCSIHSLALWPCLLEPFSFLLSAGLRSARARYGRCRPA